MKLGWYTKAYAQWVPIVMDDMWSCSYLESHEVHSTCQPVCIWMPFCSSMFFYRQLVWMGICAAWKHFEHCWTKALSGDCKLQRASVSKLWHLPPTWSNVIDVGYWSVVSPKHHRWEVLMGARHSSLCQSHMYTCMYIYIYTHRRYTYCSCVLGTIDLLMEPSRS